MMTWAPCSRLASAMAYPMPEVPPMIKTRLPRSLERYLDWSAEDIVVARERKSSRIERLDQKIVCLGLTFKA